MPPTSSTQRFLEIEKIKEGMVLLRNKSMRAAFMVSSQNFALKSEDEQNAIIYQFQNFLNSLDFPLEIVVQSRTLKITGYLEKLKELEKEQENELLKTQTAEYQNFIRDLIAGGAIMTKNFFVVVPFTLGELMGTEATKGPLKSKLSLTLTDEQFQRCKSQLWHRAEFVAL